MFNRDEPDREKQVHVTVKASDHGKPPLEDVCTIAVKIKDINDNAPIFDRANYDVPVPQVRQNMENVLEFFFSLSVLRKIVSYRLRGSVNPRGLIKDFPIQPDPRILPPDSSLTSHF